MEPQSEQTSPFLRSETVPIGNHLKHIKYACSGWSFYPEDDLIGRKLMKNVTESCLEACCLGPMELERKDSERGEGGWGGGKRGARPFKDLYTIATRQQYEFFRVEFLVFFFFF